MKKTLFKTLSILVFSIGLIATFAKVTNASICPVSQGCTGVSSLTGVVIGQGGYGTTFTATPLTGVNTDFLNGAGLFSTPIGSGGTVTSVETDSTLTGGPITTTGTLGINLSNPNNWLALQTYTFPSLSATTTDAILLQNTTAAVSGNQQVSPAFDLVGEGFGTTAGTSQQVAFRQFILPVQGTVPTSAWQLQSSINGSTFTNAMTLTNTGTLTIGGNLSSAGNALFNGSFQTAGTATISNLYVLSNGGSQPLTATQYIFGGATTVYGRTAFYGGTSTTIAANASYGAVIIGSAPITTPTTGTNGWIANAVVKSIGTVTSGGAAITNSATLYVENAIATAANNYALYVGTGLSKFLGSITSGGSILTTAATSGGIGYGTGGGAGGTVTQATSKSTGVTLNAYTGTITMNNAALVAGTIVSFTVTDSDMTATDVVAIQHDNGGTLGAYTIDPSTSAAGSFVINVRNDTAGSLSEALVLRFAIIKGSIN
jgi:hypothetical protein